MDGSSGAPLFSFGGQSASTSGLRQNGIATEFVKGDASALSWYHWVGQLGVTAQIDVTTNTTLANVTGLSVTLVAGKTYHFTSRLYLTADSVGGYKVAIGGTATATAIVYQVNAVRNDTNIFTINSQQTALAGAAGAAGGTAVYVEIDGTITCNAAGTLTTQFAQNVSNGTSSVLRGSSMEVKETPL